ncbi:MAG TPA: glutamate-1-semialdehyde 2,1-aminomutase [Candidatus Acidoferrales bacterium]|nr:glutamate-1-semialdehyde 2,1-aminomutase [Candidatus Acidoferrales bacterium]
MIQDHPRTRDDLEPVLAGGASSPVRAGAAVGGAPFVQRSGRGAYAYDEAGRAYVDYLMAYGPLLFGHAHPAFAHGLDALAAEGAVFGSTHSQEVHLAERIRRHLPSMERVRFVSTGTEAMMSALRVARAFTGRRVIIRFAGNYHGHFDAALYDAGASAQSGGEARSGISERVRAETPVARYNDLADVDRLLESCAGDLAAIALEPVVGNMGLVLPQPGFVDGLFARAKRLGALVIFDEVITWLRLGLGGGQGAYGWKPDLTALGKVMGGGFPLAAFGGSADVMAVLAPQGSAFTGGTFSGNPFCVALGHRVLDLIEADPQLYVRLDATARSLADGIRAIFASLDLPYAVSQLASIVDFKFRPGPPAKDYDEARQADRGLFAEYYHEMRRHGILLAPSQNEVMFLSTAHGRVEVDRTLTAIRASLDTMRQRRRL